MLSRDGEKPADTTVELPVDLIYIEDGKIVFWSMVDKALHFMVSADLIRVKAVLERLNN